MAVPARPVSGAPTAADWGGIVHDEVVALEIQTGTFIATSPGSSTFADAGVVFPHPFAGIPDVFTTMGSIDNIAISAGTTSVTANGFTCRIAKGNGNLSAFGWTVRYLAIGPRA